MGVVYIWFHMQLIVVNQRLAINHSNIHREQPDVTNLSSLGNK
jgi:hypothetical protein